MPNHITSNVPLRNIAEPKRKWLYAPSVIGLLVSVWLVAVPPDTRGMETAAAWLVGFGTTIVLLLHFLVNHQNPFDRMVSDYAESSRFGFLMNTAFVFIGISGILLGTAYSHYIAESLSLPLSLAGVAIMLLSIFTTGSGLKVALGRTEGWYHDFFVCIGFGLVIVSMAQFGISDLHRGQWQWVRGFAFGQLGISLVSGMALGVVALNRIRQEPKPPVGTPAVGQGLCERVLIFLLLEWVGFLCWALLAGFGTSVA